MLIYSYRSSHCFTMQDSMIKVWTSIIRAKRTTLYMALNVSFSQGKELSHLSCTTSSRHFRTNSGIDMLTFRAWRQSVKLYERGIEIGIGYNLYFYLILSHLKP